MSFNKVNIFVYASTATMQHIPLTSTLRDLHELQCFLDKKELYR